MKLKVLILQNVIPHYRKALYNLLANDYELTIIHSGAKSVTKSDQYEEIILPARKIGPFYFQRGLIKNLYNGYDVIIAMCDFHWPEYFVPLFVRPKSIRFILWGSWLTKKYFADLLKVKFAKMADSNIYYCEQHKENFLARKVPENKAFVANNTFDAGFRIQCFINSDKCRVLFVGSLDERKENDILIRAFRNIKDKIQSNIFLSIVGEGAKMDSLVELVEVLGISEIVKFEGKITDTNILSTIYSEAVVSVSHGQAGLSVLQSLGYGVPFITKTNAISGGEKTNIIHGYNGYFCDGTLDDLENRLLELCNDLHKAREMGKNAFDYYSQNCTLEKMADGFKFAINSQLIKL